MITITGKVEDAGGVPQHVLVSFTSTSTPLAGAGIITGNSRNSVRTLPSDGTFEIDLKAGNYSVSYLSEGFATTFNISLDPLDDGDTLPIEDVVSSPLTFVAAAPNTIWNGTRAGHITFDPIANPAAPTLSEVAYTGGNLASETHQYKISYITQEGETALSPAATLTGSGVANKACRVTMAVNPTRVVTKRIWRKFGDYWYVLVELGPSVAYYDDWENDANFADHYDSITGGTVQEFNTTAGIIYSSVGSEILYFSNSGLRCLTTFQCDGAITALAGIDVRVSNIIANGVEVKVTDGFDYPYHTLYPSGAFELNDGLIAVYSGNLNDLVIGLSATNKLLIEYGAAAGYVLTSDASGYASWQPATGGTASAYFISTPGQDPNTVITATRPAIAYDSDGAVWIKTGSGTNNTGWEQRL